MIMAVLFVLDVRNVLNTNVQLLTAHQLMQIARMLCKQQSQLEDKPVTPARSAKTHPSVPSKSASKLKTVPFMRSLPSNSMVRLVLLAHAARLENAQLSHHVLQSQPTVNTRSSASTSGMDKSAEDVKSVLTVHHKFAQLWMLVNPFQRTAQLSHTLQLLSME
jgi:hypothetical protein